MKVKTKPEIHDHIFDEYDHQHLEPNKVYEVIGLSDEYFRIIDEMEEPILYPKYLFEVIDPMIPDWWVRREGEEGSYYIDPPEMCKRGFYENYFDHKPEAIEIFERFLVDYGLKTE